MPSPEDSKTRIAVVGVKYFPSKGGTSRVVEDLLGELSDRYSFTLYCYSHPEARSHMPGIEIIQLPELPGGAIGVLLYYILCSLHLLVRGGVDLVHVHKIDAAPVIPLLSLRFPCVATSHEAPYRRDKWGSVARAFFRWAEQRFGKSSATLTCVSETLAGEYRERFGRDVRFIGNGLRDELAGDDVRAAAVLDKHGVDGEFWLFAARRIMATKGAHTAIEALPDASSRPPLLIVGDFSQVPGYSAELKALAARAGSVVFIDPLDRETLMGLLARASLFVFPSEFEGMSVMLLEAARMRTPIVASDIPENTGVLSNDEALFFECKNTRALARCFEQARAQPEEMRERALRARERVEREFSIQAVAAQYAAIYDALAGAGDQES